MYHDSHNVLVYFIAVYRNLPNHRLLVHDDRILHPVDFFFSTGIKKADTEGSSATTAPPHQTAVERMSLASCAPPRTRKVTSTYCSFRTPYSYLQLPAFPRHIRLTKTVDHHLRILAIPKCRQSYLLESRVPTHMIVFLCCFPAWCLLQMQANKHWESGSPFLKYTA